MSQLRILLGERETAVNQHGIIRRRVSMNRTRTLFSRMNGLASRRLLNDGNAIPLVGFGVYNTRPGKETEQAVLWALDVSCCMPWQPPPMLQLTYHWHAFIGWLSSYRYCYYL